MKIFQFTKKNILAGMVPEPIIYLKTVDILMNEIEKGLKKLDSVLTPQTILIVSVTASTTSGKVCYRMYRNQLVRF